MILSKIIPDLRVCRTVRVPEEVPSNVIVYDIGYGRFDHHQKGRNGERGNGIPYAACGLIWKEFGPMYCEKTFPDDPDAVWAYIDACLVQAIDAFDNGVKIVEDPLVKPMSFSAVINGFFPSWDSQEDVDAAFMRAFYVAEAVFDNAVKTIVSKLKARSIVAEAVRRSVDHVVVLNKYVPWQDYVCLSEDSSAKAAYFVVFPSNRGGYNWQCVPETPGSFSQRKPVPESWRGLRDQELRRVTGVKTATFCHPGGFLGGAETLPDTLKMAYMALREEETNEF